MNGVKKWTRLDKELWDFVENGKGSKDLLCAEFAGNKDLRFDKIRERYLALKINYKKNYKDQRGDKEVVEQPREHYQPGDIIEVKIEKIVDYGAIIRTIDKNDIPGLLHISEIINGYVGKIENYIQVGDILPAKVIPEPCGRLAVSTKEIGSVKPKIKSIVYNIEDKIKKKSPGSPIDRVKFTKKILREALDVLSEIEEDTKSNEDLKDIKGKLAQIFTRREIF